MINLIINALPRSFHVANLKQMIDEKVYQRDPLIACEKMLRANTEIDWAAYLARYPDVAAAGVDPITHFLNHGMFEGRKLVPFYAQESIPHDSRPKISIVIPCYNACGTIVEALESVLKQSMTDLEVIIIDNSSDDTTTAIIKKYAGQDPRVKIILLESNRGQHTARKLGVAASSGRYVMFLDADDTLSKDSCARAFAAISKGYHIVAFNTELIGYGDITGARLEEFERYVNCGAPGELNGESILEEAFTRGTQSDLLWNKIYDGGMCRHAFNIMEEALLVSREDKYEFFVLATHAKSFMKIPDILYRYNIPARPEIKILNILTRFQDYRGTWAVLDRYLTATNNGYFRSRIMSNFIGEMCNSWLRLTRAADIRRWYDLLVTEFGMLPVISHLASEYSHSWRDIAKKFKKVREWMDLTVIGKHIGLMYTNFGNGNLEPLLTAMMNILLQAGYEVYLLLEEPSIHVKNIPNAVKVHYCPLPAYNGASLPGHLESLASTLKQCDIDTVIFNAPWSMSVLWQLMLCHHLGIKSIIYNHEDFYGRLSHKEQEYGHKVQNQVFRCADKVWCPSILSELYYRAIGIDAQYVPYPLTLHNIQGRIRLHSQPTITIFGFIGADSFRHWEAIRTIWMVLLKAPQVRIAFYGRFVSDGAREAFYATLHQLGINEFVKVLYPEGDLRDILDRTDIILSCSDLNSFSHEIFEGLTMGVPCVMYRHPYLAGYHGKAIYQVEPGDKPAMAEKVLELIDNENEWYAMSRAGVEDVPGLVGFPHQSSLVQCLENMNRSSFVANYDDEVYEALANILLTYIPATCPIGQ